MQILMKSDAFESNSKFDADQFSMSGINSDQINQKEK